MAEPFVELNTLIPSDTHADTETDAHADTETSAEPEPESSLGADQPLSPLRRQYLEIKRQHPDLVVLFQIGDFYEGFDADAAILSRELGLTLTRKHFGKNDVRPLAGLPIRAVEPHLAKLLRRGYKVALCEQVTQGEQVTPPGKGLVVREVTRVITPGTLIEPALLEGRSNNYLVAWVPHGDVAGIACADISTGEFRVCVLPLEAGRQELARMEPAELLLPGSVPHAPIEVRAISHLSDEGLTPFEARRTLLLHFQARSLDAYGCEGNLPAIRAAAAIIGWLRASQPEALVSLTTLHTWQPDQLMQLDPQTLRNLELFSGWDVHGATTHGSLLATLDACVTPMGARMLKRWLRYPLLDLGELQGRQAAVEWFYVRDGVRSHLRRILTESMDLERTVGRIRRLVSTPQEVVQLRLGLEAAAECHALLLRHTAPRMLLHGLEPPEALTQHLKRALTDDPPSDFERGGIIRPGFSEELDRLRTVLASAQDFLQALETRERTRTGIKSLKVEFNRVFGYYIEISRANLRFVPSDYIRKQTLANCERYFTLELKEHEAQIANARERILELEKSLFRLICLEVTRHVTRLSALALSLSRLDVLAALADGAVRHRWVKPQLDLSERVDIVRGRHPMVERMLPYGDFVPNDTHLSCRETQIMLLTAPNMAGKSVYLRQVALIVLMAQLGSFVPADEARIGLVDRVFTRVGLHEYAARGQSSFMLEMVETAWILHHASSRSLILLDEVGRGTATADGLSIARAVVEYLHNHPRARARALFATHYHELTDCEDYLPRVRNFHLAVDESGEKVRWLHRLVVGRSEKSFGIHVAALAGMPSPVLKRAQTLLKSNGRRETPPSFVLTVPTDRAQTSGSEATSGAAPSASHTAEGQLRAHLPNASAVHPLIQTLARTRVEELSPLEAITRLYELRALAEGYL